jgi:arginyl-tRNA--protein-N-Asp/Glu arginylyltransferase
MSQYNLTPGQNIDENYFQGLLPQRNNSQFWYSDTSSRSNLINLQLTSENRRIINKTNKFTFEIIPLKNFSFIPEIQKIIYSWIKKLEWNFPISSVKTIFTNHIFNYLYIWKDENGKIVAYSICYISQIISHIAYVFYDPKYSHDSLPIRLVLQLITDSHDKGLNFCYLGRFSPDTGYYKRNMPGFEYFENDNWIKYEK